MTATYDSIATTTLGSANSTITFSSIPNTYTDLRVVFTAQGSGADRFLSIRYNGDTGTNYSYTNMNGNGTNARSTRGTSMSFISLGESTGSTTTNPSFYTIDLFSYAGSTNKTALMTNSADQNGSGEIGRQAALWRSTAAVTSITLFAGGNFAIGATATLYGITRE